MVKIGFIVNPVAGIGGTVGLKGSDGEETQTKARALGAVPASWKKAEEALKIVKQRADKVQLYTCPGEMGESVAKKVGFSVCLVGSAPNGPTTPEHTVRAAQALCQCGVDLLVFVGGDGTARNVLDAVGASMTVVGIPAGCKIYSAVYAINPRRAGELIVRFIDGAVQEYRESEVLDINEELFRENIVEAKLYGYMRVPNERKLMQNLKSGSGGSEDMSISMISNHFADNMLPDTLYVMGPGSTVNAIMKRLGLENTLLGIDLVYNRSVVARDVSERVLLQHLEQYRRVKIIVTIIGGQGYLFGRGNQQLSAAVLRRVGKENIIVTATKDKMLSLLGNKLYIDTGEQEVNRQLAGYYKVVVGYDDMVMFEASD